MPRRKVRDEDRQRAATACLPCKRAKVRCDAQLPCATCVRKDRIALCTYNPGSEPTGFRQKFAYAPPLPSMAKRRRLVSDSGDFSAQQRGPTTMAENDDYDDNGNAYGKNNDDTMMSNQLQFQRQLQRIPSVDGLAAGNGLSGSGSWDGNDNGDGEGPAQDNADGNGEASRSNGPAVTSPETTQSRLILNNRGEKVFIGEIASLSFLQFLRHTLRYQMGASAFTEAKSRNVMLEVETANHHGGDSSATISIPATYSNLPNMMALLKCFTEVSSGILHLPTAREFGTENFISDLTSTASSHTNAAAERDTVMWTALSIGAQCRGEPQDLQYATKTFHSAQTSAFEDMLCNPSVDMIKTFLLMSFYMLGACRRNAAFMYLGVAAKAACALGLHSKDYYANLSTSERNNTKRVWKSLLTLDTVVSAVLGRPSSLAEGISEDLKFWNSEEEPADLALNACYGACALLRWFIQHVPGKQNGNITITESFLERLRNWSQNLHPDLRQFSNISADAERLIGNTHVGCIYYFTVMLATRPFLISHLLAQIQKSQQGTVSAPHDQEKVTSLAETCLDAAIHLSQLCHTVLNQGAFHGNMCLVKAFVFAAGLLLGFHLFAAKDTDTEAQIAFNNVQIVLQQLSYLSPQAKHYHEILHDFGDAVDCYHRQKLDKKRRVTSRYLDHIFDMSKPQSNTEMHVVQQRYLSPVSRTSELTQTEPQIMQDALIAAPNDSFPDFDIESIMEMYDPETLPLVWDDFGPV